MEREEYYVLLPWLAIRDLNKDFRGYISQELLIMYRGFFIPYKVDIYF